MWYVSILGRHFNEVSGPPATLLAALRVAAVETRHTPIHHHHRSVVAFGAELRAGRKLGFREGVGLLGGGLEFGALLGHQLFLVFVQLVLVHQPDHDQVLLDDFADLGDQRGHEMAARLPVAAARIEHRFQFLHQEGHVAALAEHRADDAGERHDPLEVVQVLGVDEDLERPALLVGRALVQEDVVDGDVHGVVGDRGLHLVGGTDEHVRPLQLLVHADDFGLGTLLGDDLFHRPRGHRQGRGFDVGLLGTHRRGFGGGFLGLLHRITGDFLLDLDAHGLALLSNVSYLSLGDTGGAALPAAHPALRIFRTLPVRKREN